MVGMRGDLPLLNQTVHYTNASESQLLIPPTPDRPPSAHIVSLKTT